MVTTSDPVASGLTDSLARPVGNITRITRLTRGLTEKRLELLMDAAPKISRVELVTGTTTSGIEDYEAAARSLKKITIQPLKAKRAKSRFRGSIPAAVNGRINAIITICDAVPASYMKRIANLTIQQRLPSMTEDTPYVEAGGLMSYSANDADQFKRAAIYVDKVLKGIKLLSYQLNNPLSSHLWSI
jgi:putative ABC transport system substrate-binding protein